MNAAPPAGTRDEPWELHTAPGMYLPPLLEALGRAELTHEPRRNRMRAT